jgi:hypothetical protein
MNARLPDEVNRIGRLNVSTAISLARRALARTRRATEKTLKELEDLEGALRGAEGEDFPAEAYSAARERLESLLSLWEEEGARLEEKILHAGGLEPGRVRRSSAR